MTATQNYLWVGNIPQINTDPNTIPSLEERTAFIGHTATGPDELEFTSLTGTLSTGGDSANRFVPTYTAGSNSEFSYQLDGEPAVSGVHATAMFSMEVRVVMGDDTWIEGIAVFAQMSNGDIFMRPNANFLNQWEGVSVLKSIKVIDTYAVHPMISHNFGFDASVYEIEIIPCFTHGTLIQTARGLRRVEDLTAGDLVKTADPDDPFKPIRWIGSRLLDAKVLLANPKLRPIRIRAGALGAGLPERDLMVSPQHRILVHSRIARNMFGADEVLVAARQLLAVEGIDVADDIEQVKYVHFMFDNHEVVYSEGAATESLYAGPQALRMVGEAARQELLEIFPDLAKILAGEATAPSARPFVTGKLARKLAERHHKADRSLIELHLRTDMRQSA